MADEQALMSHKVNQQPEGPTHTFLSPHSLLNIKQPWARAASAEDVVLMAKPLFGVA